MSKNQVSNTNSNKSDDSNIPYFQSQTFLSLQCGLHSVNNLLKAKKYDKNAMEEICNELSNNFINPHKYIFGGDYDANVLMVALQRHNRICDWIDKRVEFNLQKYLQLTKNNNEPLNFLVNQQGTKNFCQTVLRFSSRHWFVIREEQNQNKNQRQFTKCDSKAKKIQQIKNTQELENQLKKLHSTQDTQILWVHQEGISSKN